MNHFGIEDVGPFASQERCVLCGGATEVVVERIVHGTPLGCVPHFVDERVPQGAGLLLPVLCWPCREKTLNRYADVGRAQWN